MTSSLLQTFRRVLFVGLLITMWAFAAYASPVVTWTGGTYVQSSWQQTVGWSFTANQTISVSDLEWYDPSGTNLLQHVVDIWTGSGVLVGTACVGSGCAGSSWAAGYWQTPVSFSLGSGSYDIAGWVDVGDSFVWFGSTVATDPSITFNMPVFLHSTSTAFPGSNTCCSSIGFFGPNFTEGTTPEPATMVLFGSGIIGLAGVLRRKINL
jgi:hypothetical protein